MSSTPQPDTLPLERLLSRQALISALALAAAIVLAWAWLVTQPMERMAGMAAMPGMPAMMVPPDPWNPADLFATFTMWALMMVAMMLPSAAPMILLHARIHRGSPAQRTLDNTLFALSYLAVWAGFSVLAAFAQAALVTADLVSATRLSTSQPQLAAGLLLLASVWQLMPSKAACLERCQSPVGFILRYWRPGPAGAIRLGIVHGLYCLGCCWSLMLLLFVGGVMNLAWVALIAMAVFAEKVAPPAWRISRWLAAVLALGAAYVLIA